MTVTTKAPRKAARPKPERLYEITCRGGNIAKGNIGVEWDGWPHGADEKGDGSKSIFWGSNQVTVPCGRFPVPPDGRPDPAAPLFSGDGINNKMTQWAPCAGTGFPEGYRPPPLFIDRRLGLPPDDITPWVRGVWLLSGRAKQAFAEIDPQAFDFAEVDTFIRDAKGVQPTEPMWFADVVRLIDALDPEQPGIRRNAWPDGRVSVTPPLFSEGGRYLKDRIGDAHIFRVATYKAMRLCDESTKKRLTDFKLRGLGFITTGVII